MATLSRPVDVVAAAPRVIRRARPWREALLATLPAWVAARAAVLAAFVLARVSVDQLGVVRPAPLLDGVMAWDAHHYRVIAEQGYDAIPHAHRLFPAFPLLVRALSTLTFGNATVAALLISNIAALVLGMALHRLVVTDTGTATAGRLSTWLLLAGPAAAPLVMGYAESLGAAASVLSFLAARRGRWWAAAAGAAVVGATWSVGWLFAVPLAVEAVRQLRRPGPRLRLAPVSAVVAPVLGPVAHVWWAEVATGDGWGRVVTVQTTVFERRLVDPLTTVLRSGEDLLFGHHASGLVLPWALLATALVVVAFRRLPASYGAYAAVVALVTLSSENVGSSERYLLRAFPLAVAGALVLEKEWQQRLAVAGGLAGLVVYATAIFLGAKVP